MENLEESHINVQFSEYLLKYAHTAIKLHDVKQFEKKVVTCDKKETLLCRVCYSNRLDLLKYLIDKCSYQPNLRVLCQACICGHLDIVVYLIEECKCDPNIISPDTGYTPLYEATANGHVEVVIYILGNHWTDGCHEVLQAALHEACYWGHLNMIRYCIEEHKCDPIQRQDNLTILHYAVYGGHVDVLKYLVDSCYCDLTEKTIIGDEPLHIACQNGHLIIVKYLVEKYNCSFFSQRNDGLTPLHCAARGGHIDVLKYLVDSCNCDVNEKTSIGEEPLHIACSSGHLGIIKCLIEEYNCNAVKKDDDGYTPLHDAALGGHVDVFKYLINSCNCDVTEKTSNGEEPLHIACQKGHLVIIKCLIEEYNCIEKFSINSSDYILSALLIACKNGHLNIIQFIFDSCFAELNNLELFSGKLLTLAVSHGFYDIVQYLLYDCPIKIKELDPSILSSPCKCGDIQMLKLLLSANYISQPNSFYTREFKKLLTQFDIGKSIPPIDSYANIFVLGDPGAGKSTLVKVLTKRNTTNSLSRVFLPTRSVTHDVAPNTVGIIPYRLEHKELGSILLHDLAGHPAYYLSHSAIIENCLECTATVFVLVVDLRDEKLSNILEKWLLMLRNTKFSNKCQFIVVGSHFDLCTRENLYTEERSVHENVSHLLKKHMNIESSDNNYIALDCRRLGGTSMDSLVHVLSKSCDIVRQYPKSNTNTQYTRMLYAYLNKCNVSVERLSSIIDMIQHADVCYLPSRESDIILSLCYLHATGLVMFLMDDENLLHNSWIIANKQIVLQEVNSILFGKQKDKAISHTGVISESDLSSLFPKYESQMLVKFLVSMKLCMVVDESMLSYTNLTLVKPLLQTSEHKNILFFPSLMDHDVKRPTGSFVRPFTFGWCLKCSDNYFPNRLLHILLLSICYKYALPDESQLDDPLQRLCTVWINGVVWTNNHGIETLLEFSHDGKRLVVLMSYDEEESEESMVVAHRKNIIKHVLDMRSEVCPNLSCSEYLINCAELNQSVDNFNLWQLNMFNIEQVALCLLKKGKFLVSSNGKGPILLSRLLPCESDVTDEDLSIFAGRKPERIISDGVHHFIHTSQPLIPDPHHSLVLNIFRQHFSKLCESLGDPEILADKLWSANLVEFPLIDDIRSLKLSRYEISKRIFESIFHCLQCFKETKQKEFFEKFCDVLKSHGTPTDEIANQMIAEYSEENK